MLGEVMLNKKDVEKMKNQEKKKMLQRSQIINERAF